MLQHASPASNWPHSDTPVLIVAHSRPVVRANRRCGTGAAPVTAAYITPLPSLVGSEGGTDGGSVLDDAIAEFRGVLAKPKRVSAVKLCLSTLAMSFTTVPDFTRGRLS